MRKLLAIIILIFSVDNLNSQTLQGTLEGSVSYISSQNVYVKFQSTDGISAGDTLFYSQNNKMVPVLKVTDKSSISCVCLPISSIKLNVGDKILSKAVQLSQTKTEEPVSTSVTTQNIQAIDSVVVVPLDKKKSRQKIHGNLAVASYFNTTNTVGANTQNMQYTFSLGAQNIGESRLSAECYITFYQKLDSTGRSEIKQDIFNGLKIYNLALSYEIGKSSKIWLGRKINPRISNMGAVDGLQYELKLKSFTLGALAGSRPDYRNYSFNANLLQYGAFISHDLQSKKGFMQTTLAFVQQNNSGVTDRRFAYLQHSNGLVKNLTFFGSVQFELYNKVYVPKDTVAHIDSSYKSSSAPKLSNLYLSLRYRVIRQLSFSLSYSAMNNIIYYETYKSFIDKMLEYETSQGYLFQVYAQPAKRLSIGVTAGYRFQKKDPKPSKNLNAYLTYSQIPGIGISATANFLLMETAYLSGKVYGLGISRDLVPGVLFASLNYKNVNYTYVGSDYKTLQNAVEASLYWRIYKKIAFSLYYEGTFEKIDTYNRIYGQLSVGF